MLILNPSRYKREGTKLLQTIEKQRKKLSLLDKREYPKGEGVRTNTASKDFKLLRLQPLSRLNRPRKLGTPLGS